MVDERVSACGALGREYMVCWSGRISQSTHFGYINHTHYTRALHLIGDALSLKLQTVQLTFRSLSLVRAL